MAAESLGKIIKIMIHKPQTRQLGGQENSLKQTKTQVILIQSCLGLEAM